MPRFYVNETVATKQSDLGGTQTIRLTMESHNHSNYTRGAMGNTKARKGCKGVRIMNLKFKVHFVVFYSLWVVKNWKGHDLLPLVTIGFPQQLPFGQLIIGDMAFERTEDHFTITTHTNQQVDLFHSLIFPTWNESRIL